MIVLKIILVVFVLLGSLTIKTKKWYFVFTGLINCIIIKKHPILIGKIKQNGSDNTNKINR